MDKREAYMKQFQPSSNDKVKMIMMFVTLMIFSIEVIAISSFYSFKKLTIENIEENNSELMTQISSSINDSLEDIEKDLKVISESKEIKTIIEGKNSSETKVDNFGAYMKVHKEIENMYFATPNKNLYMYPVFNMGDRYDATDRKWYTEAVISKDYVWSTHYVAEKVFLSLSMPVYSNEELVGVMAVDINLSYLDEKLQHTKLSKNGYVMLTDGQGFNYITPNRQDIIKNLIPDKLIHILNEEIDEAISSYSEDGMEKVVFISNINKGNFKLVGIVEQKELFSSLGDYLKRIILISIVIVIISTICTTLASIYFVRKLKGYKEKEEVKSNNMDLKIDDKKSNDLEDKLNRLKDYKYKKIITEAEYESKRDEIIKNYDV